VLGANGSLWEVCEVEKGSDNWDAEPEMLVLLPLVGVKDADVEDAGPGGGLVAVPADAGARACGDLSPLRLKPACGGSAASK